MIPVFVINLPRSGERRAFMETQLGALGVPFGFFTAIDGTQVPPSARAKYDPSIPIGFVGCGESHLALLRQIRDGDSEFVCVLEDDAVVAPTTLQLLDPATLRSLSRFDVLRLESYPRRGKRLMLPIAKLNGVDLVSTYQLGPATTGQIFSRDGARKILAGISFLRVSLDVALFHFSYVMGLRVIEARPSLVRPNDGFPSTIGPGREPPYTAWEKFLYRRLRMRELRNIVSFLAAWGLPGLMRVRLS